MSETSLILILSGPKPNSRYNPLLSYPLPYPLPYLPGLLCEIMSHYWFRSVPRFNRDNPLPYLPGLLCEIMSHYWFRSVPRFNRDNPLWDNASWLLLFCTVRYSTYRGFSSKKLVMTLMPFCTVRYRMYRGSFVKNKSWLWFLVRTGVPLWKNKSWLWFLVRTGVPLWKNKSWL